MKKLIITLVVLGVAGLLGWQVYGTVSQSVSQRGQRGRPRDAVAVELAPVRTATVRDVRVFTGTLNPSSQFLVASKAGGRLERLTVRLGNPVRRGQLIALIDDAEYRQQMLQARAEMAVAAAGVRQCNAKLALAEVELKRLKELHAKNISSKSEVDTAESEFSIAKANLDVAQALQAQKEAAFKAADLRLDDTKVYANWGLDDQEGEGPDKARVRHVGERFVDVGAMLTPNTPILSIVEINSLVAVIHVTERDYPIMKVGQKAAVSTDAFPGRTFPASIALISQVLHEASRQARIELDVPNATLILKPGMFVRVRVEFDRHENATVIPREALARYKEQQGVFVIEEAAAKARFIAVKTGIAEGNLIEVVEPSLKGSVVTLGHHLLSDGTDVVLTARRDGTKAEMERSEGAGPRTESSGIKGRDRR